MGMKNSKVLHGDSLSVLKTLKDNSIDSVVTDPPYGISFMGKKWDYDVPSVELWREVFRVLKPGGHVLSFGGTRTYHRMVVNIEDAGFEIRDQLQWIYGSGFPKSTNVALRIDKESGAIKDRGGVKMKMGHGASGITKPSTGSKAFPSYESVSDSSKQWQGWGTALKPANEPIVMARKPLEGTVAQNVEKWWCGGINVDGCRIGFTSEDDAKAGRYERKTTSKGFQSFTEGGHDGLDRSDRSHIQGRWPANVIFDEWDEPVLTLQDSIPEAVKTAIKEYYAGYCKVSNLRQKVSYLSEPQGPQEILQSGMLREGLEQNSARQESSDVWQETLAKFAGQDAQDKEAYCQARERQSDLQGLSLFSRIQVCESGQPIAEGQGACAQNDSERSPQFAGASASDGAQTGATVETQRSRASSKRNKGRQSTEQLGATRHEPPQERTLASTERGEASPLLVRESDVPQMWSRYFKDSGFTVRAGAAAMLDEQSGLLKNGGKANDKERSGLFGKRVDGNQNQYVGDSGGASRFFYVAKASKRERNAGIDKTEFIWENDAWEKPDLKLALTGICQLAKDISADILADDSRWNTDLYGHSISEQYPKGMTYTIETALKLIIELKISSASQSSNTSAIIQDAIKMIEANGLSLAASVAFTKTWNLNTISEETGLVLGAVSALLPMLLTIKGYAKSGNFHSTVKPIKLMEYLCKLITPPGGIILDPFCGSGSTGVAAKRLGFEFVGIEREKEYIVIAEKRIWSV